MLDRYTTDEMRMIWSDNGTMSLWSNVERMMAEAQGAPKEVVAEMWEKRLPTAEIGVDAWKTREGTTRHDVVAFIELMRESLSPEAAKWVHRGVTSSDLVDSAMAIRVKRSLGMIAVAGQTLTNELGSMANRYSKQPWIGRTHGQWGQETTLGHLFANRAMLMNRATLRVREAQMDQMVMMSGPVGDHRTVTSEAERAFGRLAMMPVAGVTTQIVARDGLAEAMWACERMMAAIAQVAMDIRLMGQSEIGEVAEGFTRGQKGSSIMAHKNNTIGAENLVGLERIVRANVMPVVEGIGNMWGMRDIAHSSVERVCVPLVVGVTEFAALRCTRLLKGMIVRTDRAIANIERTGGVLEAGPLVTWLTEKGASPEAAWQIVHEASQDVEREDNAGGKALVRGTQKRVNELVRRGQGGWGEFNGNWAEWQ